MEFGVWFGDEMRHIMQSIATTGDDFVDAARKDGDPKLLDAYQKGFHAALRSMAQAFNIEPPEMGRDGTLQLAKPKPKASSRGAAKQQVA